MEAPLPPTPPEPARPTGRVAILGTGNELDGDDGAGILIVRQLAARAVRRPGVLILEGGSAPENLTGALRRFAPDVVVLVDAADFCDAPGTIAWIPWEDADGVSASTHTLPPTLLSRYLRHELGCQVVLLGIQPASLAFGDPLSAAVAAAVENATALLDSWLAGEAAADRPAVTE